MVVLDVSAALAIVRKTPEGQGLMRLLFTDERIIAPQLFCSEAANSAWQFARLGNMGQGEAAVMLRRAVALVDRFESDGSLVTEALSLAVTEKHPVYDLLYVVLARRTGSTLFTLDKKLQRLCVRYDVNCVDLAKL